MTTVRCLATPIALASVLLLASADVASAKGPGHRGGHHHHHHGKASFGISLNFGSPRLHYAPPPVLYQPYRYYYPGVRYVVAPPPGYVMMSFGGVRYCYHEGTYYRPVVYEGRPLYQVVDAPPQATAPTPAVAQTAPASSSEKPDSVSINGETYVRSSASTQRPSLAAEEPARLPMPVESTAEFRAVAPPIGSTHDVLPSGATALDLEGTRYYQSGETYYLPIRVADAEKFVVVNRPR